MKERCSTYMILDARPREDFSESQMLLPNVISIPEEILNLGFVLEFICSKTALLVCDQH